jgi:hypothetical protein
MGRNTMRSSVNNAMRQRLFTEYLNEQKTNKTKQNEDNILNRNDGQN